MSQYVEDSALECSGAFWLIIIFSVELFAQLGACSTDCNYCRCCTQFIARARLWLYGHRHDLARDHLYRCVLF